MSMPHSMRRLRVVSGKAAVAAAATPLVIALGTLTGCTEKIPDDCHIGRLTDEGGVCQTMRTPDGTLYSFYADMNGYSLGEKVCACGAPAQMSRCKEGVPLDLRHFGRECRDAEPFPGQW